MRSPVWEEGTGLAWNHGIPPLLLFCFENFSGEQIPFSMCSCWDIQCFPEHFHGNEYSKSAKATVTKVHRFGGLKKSISSQFKTSQTYLCQVWFIWRSFSLAFRWHLPQMWVLICICLYLCFSFPSCNDDTYIVLASTLIASFCSNYPFKESISKYISRY